MENKINLKSTDITLWNQKTTTELDDSCCSNNDSDQSTDQNQNINSSQIIANFVIGILKPGQKRIGLVAANKNKITISGVLGIDKLRK